MVAKLVLVLDGRELWGSVGTRGHIDVAWLDPAGTSYGSQNWTVRVPAQHCGVRAGTGAGEQDSREGFEWSSYKSIWRAFALLVKRYLTRG